MHKKTSQCEEDSYLVPALSNNNMDDSHDDPLSKTTARLSISVADGEIQRGQVAELLREAGKNGRRDSAISLSSHNEADDGSASITDISQQNLIPTTDKKRRRRSSAQSGQVVATKKLQTEPTVKEKVPKKHKKKLQKAKQSLVDPQIVYMTENDSKLPKKLALSQLRSLIQSVFQPTEATANKKRGLIRLLNAENVPKVVFCFIPGLSSVDFNIPEEQQERNFLPMPEVKRVDGLEFLHDKFQYLGLTTAPGTKETLYLPLKTLTSVLLTNSERKAITVKLNEKKLVLWDLLVSKDDMHKHGYPLHSESDFESTLKEGWVETKSFEHEGSHTFALDCEFCQAASGKVLTRISLVNFQEEVVFDWLVKPEEEITDYITKYSGITAEKLEGVTTTLSDVQQEILKTISSTDILIGHSLESDLNVMKVRHPRIIDTSLSFEHVRGPPAKPSLKWLAEKFLEQKIQAGEQTGEGHSSIEDAKACLSLIKLKLHEGASFGLNFYETSLFERLNGESEEPVRSLIIDYNTPRGWHNDGDETKNYLKKAQVTNDDEVVDLFKSELEKTSLTFLHLRELEYNSGWSPVPTNFDGFLSSAVDPATDKISVPLSDQDRKMLWLKMNERLENIYSALPEKSLMLVSTGSGDTTELHRLQAVRRHFQNLERLGTDVTGLPEEQKWDFNKITSLLRAAASARLAISFTCIKPSVQ